jgi:hypothetical protein
MRDVNVKKVFRCNNNGGRVLTLKHLNLRSIFDNKPAAEDQDWASYVEGVKAATIPQVTCRALSCLALSVKLTHLESSSRSVHSCCMFSSHPTSYSSHIRCSA